jgi:hypothetical protein
MKPTIENLNKRRRMMFLIILFIGCVGIIIDNLFKIEPLSYFDDAKINLYMVYFLIGYKVIELNILYFFFYHRHLLRYFDTEHSDELLMKFDKNAKRFFMLVPHGSVIFGIISYKLTSEIGYFLIFLLIASIALYLVKPKKILDYKKN